MLCYRIFFLHFVITALFTWPCQVASAQDNLVKWEVEKSSTLQVNGKSNVNSFACSIKEYTQKDTIVCGNNQSKPVNLSGEVQMDVAGFDCHSSFITKSLRKTLKADTYPQMTIRFLNIEHMPGHQPSAQMITGWVEVELAGVTKKFQLTYSFANTGQGNMQLSGSHGFRFSDFKLSPPRKLGGLIKIKDDFDVHFQMMLKSV